ncbi:HBL057Cp [Eremothecium sinecaudum]|uniref:non-specific serine/threonine protein kinase n=1 Tax=Eremothecium sinecaudum TaxID=45286 RepID=A0A109UWK2_9SACH|nr:HBL057Cp [Eremothecium sinecaudum]AMD18845.1 HBL057Cp [Eremothecium sinecaudum]
MSSIEITRPNNGACVVEEDERKGTTPMGLSTASSIVSAGVEPSERFSSSISVYRLEEPKRRTVSISSAHSISYDFNMEELLAFPNMSTHAYSYNPLSKNSLTVRLSILKRSIEIMIKNPTVVRDAGTPQDITQLPSFASRSRLDRPHSLSGLRLPLDGQPQQLRNASSAALSALFNGPAVPPPLRQGVDGSRSHLPSMLSSSKLHSLNGSQTKVPAVNQFSTAWEIGSDAVDVSETASDFGGMSCFPESVSPLLPGSPQHVTNTHEPSHMNKSFPSGTSLATEHQQDLESQVEKYAELESLLRLLDETLEDTNSANASDLLMISLLNINKMSLDVGKVASHDEQQRKYLQEEEVKKLLLDSLAQPFHEGYNDNIRTNTGHNGFLPGENVLPPTSEETVSIVDPTEYHKSHETPRIFHSFIPAKYTAPQAILTCSENHPWQFRAANDLACLIFGISKLALRSSTLLDLIHSDCRSFVFDKIMSTEGQEQVFTGEVVGIIQPGSGTFSSSSSFSSASSSTKHNVIWASVWAKRKNGLIVCVFEKVPCDHMDVMLDIKDFAVKDIVGGEGLQLQQTPITSNPAISSSDPSEKPIKTVKFANEINDVKSISTSLAELIDQAKAGVLHDKNDELLPLPIRISNHINRIRYFTLNHLSLNIPCAITSSILEGYLKLQIHCLPYQAGIFILDSRTLELVSFNKSISKNMFGFHYAELINKHVTKIIPSLPGLLHYHNTMYPHLDIHCPKNISLVLTEHYFRKLVCESTTKADDFYSSVGIDAVHRDGHMLKIDIQLRVLSPSSILLWITHSRDVFFKDYNSNPSQLKMFNEKDITSISSGASSTASSEHPSCKIKLDELKHLKAELQNLTIEGNTSEASNNTGTRSEYALSEYFSNTMTAERAALSTPNSMDTEANNASKTVTDNVAGWEIAKEYSQDKYKFVSDKNFKVDENLILNTTLATEQGSQTETSDENAENKLFSYSNNLELGHEIGALKHIKKYSDFIVLQKMGEGAYSKVNLCVHKEKQYVVAVKLIFKERILVDTWVRDRKLGTIPSEIQIISSLNKKPHDNILPIYDFFEDDEYYYIESPIHGVTGSIDLFDLIELKTNMTEYEAKLLFKQVAAGLKHLHDNGIVHRDIKDENVIVDNRGRIKIIDFGSAAYVKKGPFDVFVGTIDYAAPEVLGGEPYMGRPQDIWATGVLLYTIIYKENPFYNIDEILDGDVRINPAISVSDDCVALILKILNRSLAMRPTIEEICDDKWLVV